MDFAIDASLYRTIDRYTMNFKLKVSTLTLIGRIRSPAMGFFTHFRRIPRGLTVYFLALGIWLATTAMHIPAGYVSPGNAILGAGGSKASRDH